MHNAQPQIFDYIGNANRQLANMYKQRSAVYRHKVAFVLTKKILCRHYFAEPKRKQLNIIME